MTTEKKARDVRVGERMMTTNGMRQVLAVKEDGAGNLAITVEDVAVHEGETVLWCSPETLCRVQPMGLQDRARGEYQRHWEKTHGRREVFSAAELKSAAERGSLTCETCAREAVRLFGAWNDQPAVVHGWPVVLDLHLNGMAIEVRQTDSGFYFTAGNLFGSQTLRCRDTEALLAALQYAANAKRGSEPTKAPEGCEVVS